MSPRNDVAIYSPFAFGLYEHPSSEAYKAARGGGGAELQTALLARTLAAQGLRVAHITYPVEALAELPPSLEVVQRPGRTEGRGVRDRLAEMRRTWRALAAADARLYVFRTGLSGGVRAFLVGALFCSLRRRRLVLAASNDLDFIFDGAERGRLVVALYRLALRRASRIVVQSEQQLELARRELGPSERVVLIPSFTEPAPAADRSPDAFLWAGRISVHKLPLRYLELARALPEVRFRMVTTRSVDTSEELARAIAEEAESLPNVQLSRVMPRERLLELTSRAVAVVGTSAHEGMPNVFLEAWARSVPVLSLHFDPDGRIESEEIGICAGGDWDRFVESARRLWEDGSLRERLGRNGRAYVQRIHSPDAVGARWREVLRGSLAGVRE